MTHYAQNYAGIGGSLLESMHTVLYYVVNILFVHGMEFHELLISKIIPGLDITVPSVHY